MDAELTELTAVAATTVVKLLATAAWKQAGSALGRLWARVHPERVETVQAELEDSRAEVLDGDEQVEQALVGEWQGRLRRLLATDPGLADELREVVAQWQAVLGEPDSRPGGSITMNATASGHGRVNQAGRDLHIGGG
jgi:hypothetical protein